MPKINAESVAAHVARQHEAVLDAAINLFVERGYHEVGLAEIATAVGLARNSIYRYVPDKSHLLVEWYRRAVPEITATWQAATSGDDPPVARLQRWAHAYLSWALSPEHRLVGPLTDALGTLDDATRSEVAELHRTMMSTVAEPVADAGIDPAEVAGVVDLLSGMVLGVARAEAASGSDPQLRARLDSAIAAALAVSDT